MVALAVTPVHAYAGRPTEPPAPDPCPISVDRGEVRAGLGLVGDRYFNQRAHRLAAVSLLDADALDEVAAELGVPAFDPLLTRRNVILRGVAVDALAATRDRPGAVFSVDTGAGPVRFRAHRPASPCRWMDTRLAEGAFRALRHRGGVRCVPLDDGVLTVGAAEVIVLDHPQ